MLQDNFFISDLHLGHFRILPDGTPHGVITFERNQFSNITEHDAFIHDKLVDWAQHHSDATLWILGDYGDPHKLYYMDDVRAYGPTVNFLYGNHDSAHDQDAFEMHFDNVYRYPIYISKRVMLSHEPRYPMPASELNVHGHLHGAVLDSDQHLCVSAHTINYQPISWKSIEKRLSHYPAASYKFLREPYRDKYIFTQPKEDVVMDKKGHIKLKETIDKYNKNHDTTIPY